VRRRLGLPQDRPLVLLSFGGYGLARLEAALRDQPSAPSGWRLGDYAVVTTDLDPDGSATPWVVPVDEGRLYGSGLRYEDLVAAVDIVLTKPGYGIIAECIANDTAILYTSRGRFVEYDVLVAEMPRYLRAGFIGHEDLYGGRWVEHLDRVLALPTPPERPPTNGAEVVAELILERLARE
jgi:hypothetical protein